MAPPTPALAQSESKTRFFQRLGLDAENEAHKRVYSMMKDEAIAGRERMVARGASILRSGVEEDATPPYSPAQIQETAMHAEIVTIYNTARSDTRAYYDQGHDVAPIVPENWVVRWLLWHVFRYRDSRNRNRGGQGSSQSPMNGSDESGESRSPANNGSQDTHPVNSRLERLHADAIHRSTVRERSSANEKAI